MDNIVDRTTARLDAIQAVAVGAAALIRAGAHGIEVAHQLDLLAQSTKAALDQWTEAMVPPCRHPRAKCRPKPGSVMGSVLYVCEDCGQTVKPEEVSE